MGPPTKLLPVLFLMMVRVSHLVDALTGILPLSMGNPQQLDLVPLFFYRHLFLSGDDAMSATCDSSYQCLACPNACFCCHSMILRMMGLEAHHFHLPLLLQIYHRHPLYLQLLLELFQVFRSPEPCLDPRLHKLLHILRDVS